MIMIKKYHSTKAQTKFSSSILSDSQDSSYWTKTYNAKNRMIIISMVVLRAKYNETPTVSIYLSYHSSVVMILYLQVNIY